MKESQPRKKPDPRKQAIAAAAGIPFAVIGYFCQFVLPGYRATAAVCLVIIALILFYTFIPNLAGRFPGFARMVQWSVSLVLAAGLLAAMITEFFILRAAFRQPKVTADYIVVLGAKVRTTGPSVSLWDRIYAARDYLLVHPDTIAVVSGGQGADEHMTEAQAMFDELTKLGIAPERIWIEDESTTTMENVTFAKRIIAEKTGVQPERLGVVSSEYHMLRAGMTAKQAGVEFVGIPAKTSRWGQLINHCMREVPAVWKYWLLGGKGND